MSQAAGAGWTRARGPLHPNGTMGRLAVTAALVGWGLAVAAVAEEGSSATDPAPRDLPPPVSREAPRPQAHFPPHGYPPLREYGYYEARFRVDQRARVAVRCLGVEAGQRTTTVRFRLEIHNDTQRDLEVLVDDSFLQWAPHARTPDRGRVRPRRGSAAPAIPPGETQPVEVAFEARGRLEPRDLHTLRFQWTLRSGLGARSMHQSTFVREVRGEEVRYMFVPPAPLVLDPWVHPIW